MTRMTSNLTDCRIIIFSKAPVPGEVKTRLIPSLDRESVALLYERMILHSLKTAKDAEVGPVELWFTPTIEHPLFHHCSETCRRYRKQTQE